MISARLSALAVVLVIGGVAGLALAGRPPAPTQIAQVVRPNVTATPLAADATPSPAAVATSEPTSDESANGEPHHRIYGEDGIFGLPGWPWRADDTPAASPTQQPSRYVFNWLQHWPGPGQKLTR
jgi:hypothetical protein